MEEVLNIKFPVYFSSVYSSTRKIQRIETILEIYSSLLAFYNSIVANVVADMVVEGKIDLYEHDVDDEDDQYVFDKFRSVFNSQINDKKFGSRLLDDLGVDSNTIKNAMKILAFNLVEDTLHSCYIHITGEATDRGKRLDRISELSVISETYGREHLPVSFMIEATVVLNGF